MTNLYNQIFLSTPHNSNLLKGEGVQFYCWYISSNIITRNVILEYIYKHIWLTFLEIFFKI